VRVAQCADGLVGWSVASYTLRSGAQLVTATPDVGDAAALLAYVNRVAAESDFLTFGPGEHGITLAEEVAFLEAGASTWRFLRKATIEGEIVGFLDLRRSPRPRLQHTGQFGISVRKDRWRQGVGRILLSELLDWAVSVGMRKIDLRMRADNVGAQALYRSLGFVEEGRVTRAMMIGGEFFDELLMGRVIDP